MTTPTHRNRPHPAAAPQHRGRPPTRQTPAPPHRRAPIGIQQTSIRASQSPPTATNQSDKNNDAPNPPSQSLPPTAAHQPHRRGTIAARQSPAHPSQPPRHRPRRPTLPLPTPLAALTLIALTLLTLTACEPSSLGQYYKGRTLHVSVVTLDRTSELRYSTIDPTGTIRHWSLQPAQPNHQLILARLKVENHTAVSAIVNIDRAAAELRDFTNATYHPLTIDHQIRRDYRQDPQPIIQVDLGQCFDYPRAIINPETPVQWQNQSDNPQQLTFANPTIPIAPNGRAQLPPKATLSHTFTQPGTYPYTCGTPGNTPQQNAEIQIPAPSDQPPDYIQRTTYFLQGSFQLPQGNGIDGYLVFEAPIGTQFRDLRWRAGDSITIRF